MRVDRGTLWIGSTAYALRNITSVQPMAFKGSRPAQRSPIPIIILIVACVFGSPFLLGLLFLPFVILFIIVAALRGWPGVVLLVAAAIVGYRYRNELPKAIPVIKRGCARAAGWFTRQRDRYLNLWATPARSWEYMSNRSAAVVVLACFRA